MFLIKKKRGDALIKTQPLYFYEPLPTSTHHSPKKRHHHRCTQSAYAILPTPGRASILCKIRVWIRITNLPANTRSAVCPGRPGEISPARSRLCDINAIEGKHDGRGRILRKYFIVHVRAGAGGGRSVACRRRV